MVYVYGTNMHALHEDNWNNGILGFWISLQFPHFTPRHRDKIIGKQMQLYRKIQNITDETQCRNKLKKQ